MGVGVSLINGHIHCCSKEELEKMECKGSDVE